MDAMISEILMAYGKWNFLNLYIAAMLICIITMKGMRKTFLFPCILTTVIIINPLFADMWNKVNGYSYWRTLWIIPILAIVASLTASLVNILKNK